MLNFRFTAFDIFPECGKEERTPWLQQPVDFILSASKHASPLAPPQPIQGGKRYFRLHHLQNTVHRVHPGHGAGEFMELAAEKVCHGDNVTGAQGPQPGVQRLGALLGERARVGRLLFHAADFCAETFQGVKWKKLAGALGAGQMGRTAAAGGAR